MWQVRPWTAAHKARSNNWKSAIQPHSPRKRRWSHRLLHRGWSVCLTENITHTESTLHMQLQTFRIELYAFKGHYAKTEEKMWWSSCANRRVSIKDVKSYLLNTQISYILLTIRIAFMPYLWLENYYISLSRLPFTVFRLSIMFLQPVPLRQDCSLSDMPPQKWIPYAILDSIAYECSFESSIHAWSKTPN